MKKRLLSLLLCLVMVLGMLPTVAFAGEPTDTTVLQGVYASDSPEKPEVRLGPGNRLGWDTCADGGIRTTELYSLEIRPGSCSLVFDLPDEIYYYQISFDVYNTPEVDSAGGYLMDYDPQFGEPSIGDYEDWIRTGLVTDPNFPWQSERFGGNGWTEQPITVNKKGGTVTLMAAMRYDHPLNDATYVAFRNLKVTRLNTTLDVSVAPAGGGTFDVAVENEPNTSVTGESSYSKSIGRGAPVTLTAYPDAGYYFEKWVDKSGALLSTDTTYSFTPTVDEDAKNAQAVFTQGTDTRVTTMLDASTLNLLKEKDVSFYANSGWRFNSQYRNGAYAEYIEGVDSTSPVDKSLSYNVTVPAGGGSLYATLKFGQYTHGHNELTVLIDDVEVLKLTPKVADEVLYLHTPILAEGVHKVTFKATVMANGYVLYLYDMGFAQDVAITPTAPPAGCTEYTVTVDGTDVYTITDSSTLDPITVPYNALIDVKMTPADTTNYTFTGWTTDKTGIQFTAVDGNTWQSDGHATAIAKDSFNLAPTFTKALNIGALIQRDPTEKAPNDEPYNWQVGADQGWTKGELFTAEFGKDEVYDRNIKFAYNETNNPQATLSLNLTIPEGESYIVRFLAKGSFDFSVRQSGQTVVEKTNLTTTYDGKHYICVLKPGSYELKWKTTKDQTLLANFTCEKASVCNFGKMTTEVYSIDVFGDATKILDKLYGLPDFVYREDYAEQLCNNTKNTSDEIAVDVQNPGYESTYTCNVAWRNLDFARFEFNSTAVTSCTAAKYGSGTGVFQVFLTVDRQEPGCTLKLYLNDLTNVPKVDTVNKAIYANGVPLTICNNGNSYEAWSYKDENKPKAVKLASWGQYEAYTIYGGAETGNLTTDTFIKVDVPSGSATTTIYGGNKWDPLSGNTVIECIAMNNVCIYGGNENGTVTGNTTISLAAGSDSNSGSISAGNIDGNANITIDGSLRGSVDGGTAKGNVDIIVNGTVDGGFVDGGNVDGGAAKGDVNITVNGTIKGSSDKGSNISGGTTNGKVTITINGSVKKSEYGNGPIVISGGTNPASAVINIEEKAVIEGVIRGLSETATPTASDVTINLSANTGTAVYTGLCGTGTATVNVLKRYTKDIYVPKGGTAPVLTPEASEIGEYFLSNVAPVEGYDRYSYMGTKEPFVDLENKVIYCNGVKTTVESDSGVKITYEMNGQTETIQYRGETTSEYTVYGGAKDRTVASTDITVRMYGCTVYGGGCDKEATVAGDTKVTLRGGLPELVYGGGKNGAVGGSTSIIDQDTTYGKSNLYAGGQFAEVKGNAQINYGKGTRYVVNIYGLSEEAEADGATIGGQITVDCSKSDAPRSTDVGFKVYLPSENATFIPPTEELDYNIDGVKTTTVVGKNTVLYEMRTKVTQERNSDYKLSAFANGYPMLVINCTVYFDKNANGVLDSADQKYDNSGNMPKFLYGGSRSGEVESTCVTVSGNDLKVYASGDKGSTVKGTATLRLLTSVDGSAGFLPGAVSGTSTLYVGDSIGSGTFDSASSEICDLSGFKELVVEQPFNFKIKNFPLSATLVDNLDKSQYYVKRVGTTCTTDETANMGVEEVITVTDSFNGDKTYTGNLVAFYKDATDGNCVAYDKDKSGTYTGGDEIVSRNLDGNAYIYVKGVGSKLTMASWERGTTPGAKIYLEDDGVSFTMTDGALQTIETFETVEMIYGNTVQINGGTFSRIYIGAYNSTGGAVTCNITGGTWEPDSGTEEIYVDCDIMVDYKYVKTSGTPAFSIGGVTWDSGERRINLNGKRATVDMWNMKDSITAEKTLLLNNYSFTDGCVVPAGCRLVSVSGGYRLQADTGVGEKKRITVELTYGETRDINLTELGFSGDAKIYQIKSTIGEDRTNATVAPTNDKITISGKGVGSECVSVYDNIEYSNTVKAYIDVTIVPKEVTVTVNGPITGYVGGTRLWDKNYFSIPSDVPTTIADELLLTYNGVATAGQKYDLLLNKTTSDDGCYTFKLVGGTGNLTLKANQQATTTEGATVSGSSAGTSKEWYREFVLITPPTGFLISTTDTGNFMQTLKHNTSNLNEQTVTYYLKDNRSTSETWGLVTAAKQIKVKLSNETDFVEITSPKITEITTHGATVSLTVTPKGQCGLETLYILPVSGGNVPTAAEMMKPENVIAVADTTATASFTGLTGGTTYKLYVLPVSQSGVSPAAPILLEGDGFTTVALDTKVEVAPTATTVEYGTVLANIPISGGTVTATGNADVAGTWNWTQTGSATILPEVDGGKAYQATFTPNDSAYKSVTAQITPKITIRTVTVTPNSGQSVVYGDELKLTYTLSYNVPKEHISGALELDDLNVGEHTILIGTLKSTSGNYTLAFSTPAVKATVTPKPVDLTWTGSLASTYDGTEKTITATVNNAESGDEVTVASYSDNAKTNAGSYTAKATGLSGAASANYTLTDSTTATQTWSIAKATAPTVAEQSKEYVRTKATTGNTVNLVALLPEDCGTTTYAVTSSSYTSLAEVAVTQEGLLSYDTQTASSATTDTITVIATMQNYGTVTITVTVKLIDKTSVTITGLSEVTGLVYNGSAHVGYTGTAVCKNGDTDVTADCGTLVYTYYKSTGGNTWAAGTTTVPTNAGTYKLVVSVDDSNETYTGSSADMVFTIDKKTVTAAAGTYTVSKVYDGTETAGTGSGELIVTGILPTDSGVSVQATPAAYSNVNVDGQKTMDIGITLTGDTNGNYTLGSVSTVSVPCSITKARLSVEGTAVASADYGTKLSAIPITGLTAKLNSATVDGTWAFSGETILDAGNSTAYTATFTPTTGGGNYHTLTKEIRPTINKISYPGTAITTTQNVLVNTPQTGVEVDLSSLISGIAGANVTAASEKTDADNMISNVTANGTKIIFDVASIAAAGKTATINVTIASTNYKDMTAVITVNTVAKDDANVTFTGTVPTEKTYGDAAFQVTASAANVGTGTGVWTWVSSDPAVLEVTGTTATASVKILKAGNATITAKYESDTTMDEEMTASITVNKATITIKASGKSIYVGDSVPSLSAPIKDTDYTVTGLVGTDVLGGSITMKYQQNSADATPDTTKTGSYDIVISGVTNPAGDNYNPIVFQPSTLTISLRFSGGGSGVVSNKPTVTTGKGGTATADNNGNVTITPDEDYQIGKITVNGKEISIPANGKLTGLTAGDKVNITFEKIPVTPGTPVDERFTDVPANVWFTESVQFAADNGLFAGTSATTFSPNAPMTRAMLWMVLYRHADATTKGDGSTWYADAQAWAKAAGISDGTYPGGSITREQLVTILWRYAGSPKANGDLSKFSDASGVANCAKDAMAWAVENGIMVGAGGKLMPTGNATRAQVAAILMRYCQSVAK